MKGCVSIMYIKGTLVENFDNFQLDMGKIGNHSTSKSKIHLPYTGPLPDKLNNATNVTISISIRAGLTVGVLLIAEQDGKKLRYPIEATPQEINDVLFPFFFDRDGHTKCDTGLDRYNLGLWQGSYINWRRLVLDEHGLDDLLFQLSPASAERVVQHIRHAGTA